MSLSKEILTVDSFQLFLNDCLPTLKKIEEMFSLIGIFFVGRFLLSAIYNILNGIRIHFISRLFKKNLTRKYGKWAVVTGCTDGIGKAYMEELAKEGMSIVLISRNETKLKETALEIKAKYNVETDIIQADFLEGRPVYERIEENLKNKEIGMLVNNVGIMLDKPKVFHNSRDDEIWGHININMATVPVLMKIVLPSMVARKKGAIVNISSLSCLYPFPYMAIYAASKVFVEFLSEACYEEYANSGITMQTIIPSYIATKMLSFNPIFTKSSFLFPPASKFAASALNTLGYSKLTTGYWPHGIQFWFSSHFLTRFLYMKLATLWHTAVATDILHVD